MPKWAIYLSLFLTGVLGNLVLAHVLGLEKLDLSGSIVLGIIIGVAAGIGYLDGITED